MEIITYLLICNVKYIQFNSIYFFIYNMKIFSWVTTVTTPKKTKKNPSTFARALRLLATFLQFLEDAADRLRPWAPRCWDSEQRCRKWIVKLYIHKYYIYMISYYGIMYMVSIYIYNYMYVYIISVSNLQKLQMKQGHVKVYQLRCAPVLLGALVNGHLTSQPLGILAKIML